MKPQETFGHTPVPKPSAVGAVSPRNIRIAIAAFSLVLAGVSASYMLREFAGYRTNTKEANAAFLKLQAMDHDPEMGRAVYTRIEALDTCLRAQTSLLSTMFVDNSPERIAQHCLESAQKILDDAPSFSLAYSVVAQSQVGLENWDAAGEALVNARATGRNESWLAQRRVATALAMPEPRSDAVEVALRADIALLLTTTEARGWIASYYLGDETVRPLIVAVAQTLDDRVQQQFLATIRRLGQGS
ncbi:hypothetical protein AQS8620_02751 [Aquimixticola soesokkakensis]|uniref:Tetratricopeptide repeat-like domain-containing protein n=1 Tax=Aquimixticola soesokkakensis TaxID=1519096 RepID=A0A1Y5TC84_9RHOB|nr:hypothetical protein [Aquimixticola soesokkakensis]SLN60757.1 hypothetical protein AQS8620_02751 [Aquimixticola soesokkakensis]